MWGLPDSDNWIHRLFRGGGAPSLQREGGVGWDYWIRRRSAEGKEEGVKVWLLLFYSNCVAIKLVLATNCVGIK